MLDLDKLFERFPRLKFVDDLASQRHFHHWELAFADVFYAERSDGCPRGGFDLVLGNPPLDQGGMEGGRSARRLRPIPGVLRKHSAVELTRLRDQAFERQSRRSARHLDHGRRGLGGDPRRT